MAQAVTGLDTPAPPVVRKIEMADLKDALAKGVDDFRAMPSHAVFLSLIYPIVGLILIQLALGGAVMPLVFPIAAGFALVGPFAALGLYPGGRHQGLIFHNILGGSMTAGTTLRRFFDLEGEVVHLTFPPTLNRQGIRSSTYVNLRRLSDVNDMLGR